MSFDRIAPFYGMLERGFARGRMQRCRVAFLDQIPTPKNILLLGEGHGRFLVPCRVRFPDAQITVVDGSAGMIDQAKQALSRGGISSDKTNFIHSDIFDWSAPCEAFDLIATHFFLDCFCEDQLAFLIPKLAQSTTPDANWLVSDFQIASTGVRRLRSRCIVSMLYAFFRIVTRLPASRLITPDSLLQQSGFVLRQRTEFDWSLLHSDWWRHKK